MRQLAVVLVVVAVLMGLTRLAPEKEILPRDFSASFPAHREHHETLLHNLGQKPLREYPGDAVRMWWVGPNPQQLIVADTEAVTTVTYETDGYKPRVVSQTTDRHATFGWTELRETLLQPELWKMTADPGQGPFTVGGRTWILEMKLADRYRCVEKIDPKPYVFSVACEHVVTLRDISRPIEND